MKYYPLYYGTRKQLPVTGNQVAGLVQHSKIKQPNLDLQNHHRRPVTDYQLPVAGLAGLNGGKNKERFLPKKPAG